MHEISRLMGIHKSRTTAYHPQCDGLVERQNRTIQAILSSFVSQHRDDWDNWVSLAIYSYNTSCHESTGFSPYEMVFGRDPRTPLEVDLGLTLKIPSSQSDYVKSIRKALHSVTVSAQKHLEQCREKQKAQLSSSRTWTPFIPGMSVWLRRPRAWKFGGKWNGPYEVLFNKGVTYKLRSREGKEIVAHHDNLKPCVLPSNKGVPLCPTPEAMDINIVPVEVTPQQVGGIGEDRGRYHRSALLRQNIQPPLRFGKFVTH